MLHNRDTPQEGHPNIRHQDKCITAMKWGNQKNTQHWIFFSSTYTLEYIWRCQQYRNSETVDLVYSSFKHSKWVWQGSGLSVLPWKWNILLSTLIVKVQSSSSSMPMMALFSRIQPRREPRFIFSLDWKIKPKKGIETSPAHFKPLSLLSPSLSPTCSLT